ERLISRLHQTRLNLVRLQVRVLIQKECGCASYNRRCHTRSAQYEIRTRCAIAAAIAILLVIWILALECAAMIIERNNGVARCDDVRLHDVIESGRALRTVARELIVGT